MPFIARQKKRLEKEGAPLAVRGFPRRPQQLARPGLPQTHPKVKPDVPTGGGGTGRQDGPHLEQGSEKEPSPFPPRAAERRAVFKPLHCAPDWRRWGEKREEGMGTATPPGQERPRQRGAEPLGGDGGNAGGRHILIRDLGPVGTGCCLPHLPRGR